MEKPERFVLRAAAQAGRPSAGRPAIVREPTTLRCSLAKSGTSLRLVLCLLRYRASLVEECARCSVRSVRITLSLTGPAWQTGAHGSQPIRAPSTA